MGIVKDCIDAHWDAVNGWPALQASFETQFRSDDALEQLNLAGIGPGDIGDRAAIVFKLQPFEVVSRETQALNFPIAVKCEIWNRSDQYRVTIDLLEEIVAALYRSKPTPTSPTFLQRATCGPPQKIAGFAVTHENITRGSGDDQSKYPVCYGSFIAIYLSKKPE
jgi:hypothetical protein